MAHHGRVLHGRGRCLCAGVLLDAHQEGLQSAARQADYRLAQPDEGVGGEAGGRMSRKSVGINTGKEQPCPLDDPEARLTYKNTEAIAQKLGMESFDEQTFMRTVEKVLVQKNGEITIELISNAARASCGATQCLNPVSYADRRERGLFLL